MAEEEATIVISLDPDLNIEPDGSAATTEAPSNEASVELLDTPPRFYTVVFEGLKNYVSFKPSFEELRPWKTMSEGLERPASVSEALSRVLHNQAHFRTNYIFITALFSVYVFLTTPSLLLAALLVGGYAAYTIYRDEREEIVIAGIKTNKKSRIGAALTIGLLFTIYTGSIMTILWALFVSLIVSASHSLLCKVPEENLFDVEEQQK